jgi:hypothetical protein
MARSLRPFTRRRRVLDADHPRHATGATSPTTAEIPEITPDVVLDSLVLHGIDGLGLARALAKDILRAPPPVLGIGQARRWGR